MMAAQRAVDGNVVYGQAINIVRGKILLEGTEVHALYDRFPYQKHALNDPLKNHLSIPIANPRSISLLCKDKWELQQYMQNHGIVMPEVARLQLDHWRKQWGGTAIIKPRFGSYGTGIRIVSSPPPATLPSVVGEEETLIQRLIRPPTGWAGIAVRQLAQRLPNREWVLRTAVVRNSTVDPVVNAHRGAEVVSADSFLPQKTRTNIQQQSIRIVHLLSDLPQGEWLIELGLDFVIDSDWKPWFIEVNAQPKGRLRALVASAPQHFTKEYQLCLSQPIRSLRKWLQ